MIPPVWFILMNPMLAEWDRRWATPGELNTLETIQTGNLAANPGE